MSEADTGCGPKVTVRGGDYTYEGVLVAAFRKVKGGIRVVVEDPNGRLFIHNATQLECYNEEDTIWIGRQIRAQQRAAT